LSETSHRGTPAGSARGTWLAAVRELYEGDSQRAHTFRFALLAFDLVTIVFIIATSFGPRAGIIETVDVVIGMVIVADFLARLAISQDRAKDFLHPATLADLAAIVSFSLRSAAKAPRFCACCGHYGCFIRIRSWRICAVVIGSSASTKS
jgi:hypothetical protein